MKYKAIRGAAHNFGASFVSGLDWAEGDQVMSHLMRAAVSSGVSELSVDLLTGKAGPEALIAFECVVVIVDDRGKEHTGRVQDIWPWTPNWPSP